MGAVKPPVDVELQGKLRGAINALPQVREDVFAACDALESFAREHVS